jgi:4-hydroxybenzoate polyprenyltransferase
MSYLHNLAKSMNAMIRERAEGGQFMEMTRHLFLSLRPLQWTKNFIVFFAFIFTINESWAVEEANEAFSLMTRATAGFLCFCLLSSVTYLLNDILDAPRDQHHPQKRFRPIASGKLPVTVAISTALPLALGTLYLSFLLEPWFGTIALGYLLITSTYSLILKRIPILDVMALSTGYVLRAMAGAAIIHVPISPWLYIVTGLGALLIGFGKRRNELWAAQDLTKVKEQRESLEGYSEQFLDQLISMVAPATLIAYIFYTFTAENLPPNHTMMLTIPFVAYGLFRYLYLVYHHNLGENPEELLITDLPLIADGLLWLLTVTVVLIMGRGS